MLVPLGEVIPDALSDLRLSEQVRELAAQLSWRGAAKHLGLSLDATRMLAADATRVRRGTKALARQRLAELEAMAGRKEAV